MNVNLEKGQDGATERLNIFLIEKQINKLTCFILIKKKNTVLTKYFVVEQK